MQIRPINFTSNYKFYQTSNNFKSVDKALDKLYKKESDNFRIYEKYQNDPEVITRGYWGDIFISANDNYDKFIEAQLKKGNIKYKKTTLAQAMDEDNIVSRMKMPDIYGMEDRDLVLLNTKKVDKLFQNEGFMYISPNGDGAMEGRIDSFMEYLESGQDIDASIINLREENNKPYLDFIDGRHRFSVLRDMGIDAIPFALDKESQEIALKYNLLA